GDEPYALHPAQEFGAAEVGNRRRGTLAFRLPVGQPHNVALADGGASRVYVRLRFPSERILVERVDRDAASRDEGARLVAARNAVSDELEIVEPEAARPQAVGRGVIAREVLEANGIYLARIEAGIVRGRGRH